MARRSRQVMAAFAVSALLAGGAVAHAANSSSGSAKSTSTATRGRHGRERGHAFVEQLPEHGRRFDAVDHPVHDTVVELRNVSTSTSSTSTRASSSTRVCAVLPPARHDRAARLVSPPPASRAARSSRCSSRSRSLAAGCGGGGAKRGDRATGRVAIGQGLTGPAGLEATVYATRPAQRLGVRVRRARPALGDDVRRRPTTRRRRVPGPARGRARRSR